MVGCVPGFEFRILGGISGREADVMTCKDCEFFVDGTLNGQPDYYCRHPLSRHDAVRPGDVCGFWQEGKK